MFAVAEITIKKLRESAFFLMLCLSIIVGYFVADMETIATQISSESILAHLINENSKNQPVLISTFFSFLLSILLASFSGAAEIPRDISSGQIQLILSKPVSKTTYMFGKYLGVLAVCSIFFLVTEASIVLFHYFSEGECYSGPLILRQLQMALAFIPFVAIIIALSCFVDDIAAIIITALYMLFSMLFNFIPILIAILPRGFAGDVENYIYILYYIFPNFIFFFVDFKFGGIVFISLLLYSFSIAAIFLMLASYRLNHMDFIKKG